MSALLITIFLLAGIIQCRPLVSLREDVQQPQVVPLTGVDPSDPRMSQSVDGPRPAAAPMTTIMVPEQSSEQGTILTLNEQSVITPTASVPLFVFPTGPLTSHATAPHTPMPTLTPENAPDISPAPQSSLSEHNVLILTIIVCTTFALVIAFTAAKYTIACLREAKRRRRFSRHPRGHRKEPSAPAAAPGPDLAARATDAERVSLRVFSFPSRPGGRAVRMQDPNQVPSEPSTGTRFSTLIASTAFRQSYPDHDSFSTQDTASTLPSLFKIPQEIQGDHLHSKGTPIIIDDSPATPIKPAKCPGLRWNTATTCRTSQVSIDIPIALVPCRESRLFTVAAAQ